AAAQQGAGGPARGHAAAPRRYRGHPPGLEAGHRPPVGAVVAAAGRGFLLTGACRSRDARPSRLHPTRSHPMNPSHVIPARRCRLATAVALLLAVPVLHAQEASTLDAVQVTAQRKVENIQDVPVSITSVDAEKLELYGSGGADIRFLSARVPSLNIESSYGRAFPRFYIRGLGNTDFDLNASQPVSLVYDEVVQESPLLKGFPLFDLERVEVLRGPQGTLFGRNTPAGVVKFDSAKPSQEFGGYAKLGYGSDDMVNFEGAVGGALGPRWSARLSALYQRRDDSVDNTL